VFGSVVGKNDLNKLIFVKNELNLK